LEFIEERCLILPIDSEIALKAGELKFSFKLHTTDALIYSSGITKGCEVVTRDPHFKGLDDVILI
jgi:predicted nucleic acid-binding protein